MTKFMILLIIVITCILFIQYNWKDTILRSFDIFTTVVPPSLPAAITVGTVYSLNRLKKCKIYCISPQRYMYNSYSYAVLLSIIYRVNLCAKVKLACFDKTGTLTEDSLDVLGVQPATGQGYGCQWSILLCIVTVLLCCSFGPMVTDPAELSPGPLLFAMATCHSLTRINGELSGDPLDIKMFLSTGWVGHTRY